MSNSDFDWMREIQGFSNRLREYFEDLEDPKPAPKTSSSSSPCAPSAGYPSTDVYMDGENLIIEMELPGRVRSDIAISLVGDAIEVSGNGKPYKDGAEIKVLVKERTNRSFKRQIQIPHGIDFDGGRVAATLQEGILRIILPARSAADDHISITIE
ncbi:MAG: hsp20-2 [Chlorobi bacterium]|nr:hsp20-2 [Chlorobiota bacterium]